MNLKSIISGFLVLVFVLSLSHKIDFAQADFREEVVLAQMAEVSTAESVQWVRFEYTEFTPSVSDYFLVDVSNGIGYLINDNSRYYTQFPLMTGAKRTPTPYKEWVVLDKNIQNNRVVFSKSGEFFRMYIDGVTRTSYGIHGYGYFDYEMTRGTKFLSLGCILVADDVLDLIEESYIANDNSLKVSTRESIDLESYFSSL